MAAQRTQADHDQDRDEEQQRQPGVGALLRASRLRCGEELRDIAELLCIRYLYLEAIEAGRYHDLPGTTYAIGFIRAYAEHLGLDSEEVVRRFKAEQSTLRRQDELAFPTPVPESGIPKGAIVFVGLIVAGLAYGAWYLSSSEEGGLADLIGPLPDRLESLVSGSNGSPPAAPGGEAPTEPAPETADVTSAPPEATTASPETAPSAGSPAPAESVGPPAAEDSAPMASTTAEAPASTAEQATDAPAGSPAPAEPAETAVTPAETDAPATEQPMAASPETAANETATPAPQAPADMAAPAAPSADSTQPPAEPGSSEPEAGTPAPAAETASPAPDASPTPETETAATPAPAEDTTPGPASEPAASPESEPEPEPGPAPAETATAETAPAAPVPTEPASEPAPQNTAPPAAPAEEPAETASAPAEQATAASGSGILIRAVDNSWVQIRDADSNETVVTRLLRAGEQITVEGRPGLLLATGNAGGLEIVVDGKVVPSIGGPGTVRRNVALDVERLKAGTALP